MRSRETTGGGSIGCGVPPDIFESCGGGALVPVLLLIIVVIIFTLYRDVREAGGQELSGGPGSGLFSFLLNFQGATRRPSPEDRCSYLLVCWCPWIEKSDTGFGKLAVKFGVALLDFYVLFTLSLLIE